MIEGRWGQRTKVSVGWVPIPKRESTNEGTCEMRIYQYFGAITLAPEGEEEAQMIERLMNNVKLGDPWTGSVGTSAEKPLDGSMVCNWTRKGSRVAHPDNEESTDRADMLPDLPTDGAGGQR